MPKVLEKNGYRFSFYSNENDENPHVHISKGNGNAKFWLVPKVTEEYAYGFTLRERRDIRIIVNDNSTILTKKWYEYFKKQ